MTLTYNGQFEAELQKLAEEELERVIGDLSVGTSAKDYPAFRDQIGYIRGLRKLVDLCADVQTIMSKR